jgi:YrbI family 3-deoxy-D-manno-octulosonate 8-phosphate phosphatase
MKARGITTGSKLKEIIQGIRLIAFDFDGVLTDNAVYIGEDGSEWVRCSRSDGMGLQNLKSLDLQLWVLSSEINPVVSARCRKLGLACRQGLGNKASVLAEILATAGLAWNEAAFVGNDINDSACLQQAGLPIVVADAHPDVVPLATYRTEARGGRGAVREICDLFSRTLTPSSR